MQVNNVGNNNLPSIKTSPASTEPNAPAPALSEKSLSTDAGDTVKISEEGIARLSAELESDENLAPQNTLTGGTGIEPPVASTNTGGTGIEPPINSSNTGGTGIEPPVVGD